MSPGSSWPDSAALFVGVAAAIVLVGALTSERSEYRASLASIEAPRWAAARRDAPHVRQALRRARHPAGAVVAGQRRPLGVRGQLGGNTTRRLEMAGSPPGWDAERILAAKTLLALVLASLVGG